MPRSAFPKLVRRWKASQHLGMAMRILHLINCLAVGGAETMVIDLASEQRRLGHEATICSMYGPGPLDARATQLGIPLVHLGCRATQFDKICRLSKYLQTHKYDVLHSHWEVWLAGAISGFQRGVPQVHTNHSNNSRRLFLQHRLASHFTSRVALLAPEIEPYISKWVRVPRRKLSVIPNGIDLSVFQRSTPSVIEGLPADSPLVGMVARLRAPKDYLTYIESAAIVARTRPEIHFCAIGDGPLRASLERRVADLGLKNFHFLGNREDVPGILRRLVVNVLSSKHEGVPISLLEGMASGCACIGSDIPGIRFALKDGEAGVLFPLGNAKALSTSILELVDNRDKRSRLVSRGLEHVQQFSSSQMAREYLNLYESAFQVAGGTSNYRVLNES